MQFLQTLIPLVLTLSLAGIVFAVGLHSRDGDLLYVFRHPHQLFKVVLAVIVIPPIAAGLLVSLSPIAPISKAAIVMMAVSPVPPLLPGKGLSAGARREYVYGLFAALSVLTVVSVPITLAIAEEVFEHHVFLPLPSLLKTVVAGVLVPLLLGVAVRRRAPELAARLRELISKVSLVLVFGAFLAIAAKLLPATVRMLGDGTVLTMAAATVISLFGGHLLGGPDPRDRATLAIASSVRHPGLALAIAGASFGDPRVAAAILLFLLVGMIVSLPYTRWMKRREARTDSP